MGPTIDGGLFKKIRENSENFRSEYQANAPEEHRKIISDCITMLERGAYYMAHEIMEPTIAKKQEEFETRIKNLLKVIFTVITSIPFAIELVKIIMD